MPGLFVYVCHPIGGVPVRMVAEVEWKRGVRSVLCRSMFTDGFMCFCVGKDSDSVVIAGVPCFGPNSGSACLAVCGVVVVVI